MGVTSQTQYTIPLSTVGSSAGCDIISLSNGIEINTSGYYVFSYVISLYNPTSLQQYYYAYILNNVTSDKLVGSDMGLDTVPLTISKGNISVTGPICLTRTFVARCNAGDILTLVVTSKASTGLPKIGLDSGIVGGTTASLFVQLLVAN